MSCFNESDHIYVLASYIVTLKLLIASESITVPLLLSK
jgi:hypothetical protein